MGFWSTVLVALRYRSGQVPVSTEPLQSFRKRLDAAKTQRIRVDSTTVQKTRNNVDLVHRVRVEAR